MTVEVRAMNAGADGYEVLATYENGRLVSGGDVWELGGEPTDARLLDAYDGPRLLAVEVPAGVSEKSRRVLSAVSEKASWVPYEGPQGGTGWRNAETGDVVYQDDPPGDTLSPDELLSAAEEHGIEGEELEEAIEELRSLSPGETGGPTRTEADYESAAVLAGVSEGAAKNWYFNATGNPPGQMPDDVLEAAAEMNDATGGNWAASIGRTPDPEEVQRLKDRSGREADADSGSESVDRAMRALSSADTTGLDDDVYEQLEERVRHDAGNAVSPSLGTKLFGHVGRFNQQSLNGDNPERAFHRGRASYSSDPDAKSLIGLGASGSSDRTITHEYGHALADAFGYDTVASNKVAHDWNDGEKKRITSEGWDFGGKDAPKKEYLFTPFGDWEDRGDKPWEDYEARGELVPSGKLTMGDRVALRVNGETVEGTVMPNPSPVRDVSELSPGERVSTDEGELMSGRGWGTVSDGVEDGTVESVVPPGSFIVIREDSTHPLQEGADPDEVARQPDVVDVIESSHGGALVSDDETGEVHLTDAGDVTEAPDHGAAQYAAKDPHTGDTHPIDTRAALRMSPATDRDWVPAAEFDESLRGEAVKFRFGAQDQEREGVVTDETGGQVKVEYVDGNGNPNSRWVNKNQSFQQSVWVAEDRKEFGEPEPSDSPPGFDRARYETMEVTERDVDWDTHVQYEDPPEVARKVATGDLLLVGLGGERVPAKVTDARLESGYGDSPDAAVFDVSYTGEGADALAGADVPYGALIEGGDGGQLKVPLDGSETDWKMWGHAEREQFIGESYPDAPVDDHEGGTEALEEGDVVEWSRDAEGPGTDRVFRGELTRRGEFSGSGNPFVELTDEDGTSRTVSLDSIDIRGVAPGAGESAVEDGPPDPEEAVPALLEEVNVAWWKMASKRDEGRTPRQIGSTYAEANAHETLAMTHQTMQDDKAASAAVTIADNHPELMEAYLDVFQPSENVKQGLNEWHEESEWKSPFDGRPFPETAEPGDGLDHAALVEGASSMRVPEGYGGEGSRIENPRVVEGDLLYEVDGEEYWGDPEEFVRSAIPDAGSTGRIPGGGTGVVTSVTSDTVKVKPPGADDATAEVDLGAWLEENI